MALQPNMTTTTALKTTPDQLWQAVLDRDRALDGTWYFGVRTTGVYCRPSCPSRRPNRENVVFLESRDEAERAGFRPCRRCKPDQIDAQADFVARASRYIDAHADEPITLAALSAAVGVSPHHLHRTFRRIVGITPRAYAESRRLATVKNGLRERGDVTSALYEAGFGSSSRLYERADARLGMTPNTYRQGGVGESISFTIVDSPFGRMLVAATARGVCAVQFGDADEALTAMLRREFPAAAIHRDDGVAGAWVQAVVDRVSGTHPHLDIPLDVRATAFQRRVWDALRTIPIGATRTYGEVAQAIGQPDAARAVARACAENPVAVVVPCHRVVRADGGPGGYRWGVERKQALLAQEQALAAD
ncbi:MAG: bifunctional DNA-binding transcriptional regulator/O6-methylguanine-DNA methyltransferase Ada [Thermomicrobiales bacterium]